MIMESSAPGKKKNNTIEFFRFLFCCVVFILHFRGYGNFESENGAFNGGYLCVEFFFIVTGYFLMDRVSRDSSEEKPAKKSLQFLISRYKKLYPPYLLSIVVFLSCIKVLNPAFSVFGAIKRGIPEILALQIFWCPQSINLHLWFISANLWASFLVYYFLLKDKETFLYLIEPISLLVFIGATFHCYGHIDLTDNRVLWISGIRAFTEIGLGCLVYEAARALEKAHIRLRKWLCSLLEILFLYVILRIMYWTRRDYKDYIVIFLFAVFVFLMVTQRGVLSKALDNRVSGFLGGLSYLMYLNQALVIISVPHIFRFGFWPESLLCLVVLLLIAWVESLVLSAWKKKGLPLLDWIAERHQQTR